MCDFDMFGVVGRAGEAMEINEVSAELLRHANAFDAAGKPVKHTIEAAEICY